MPLVRVLFYQERDGSVPVLDWFDGLPVKVQDKVRVRIERLRDLGHGLRRPEADYLGDGIYELRIGYRHVNYRVLYFFHGESATILAHALVKERQVPPEDIAATQQRKALFQQNPKLHTYSEGAVA